MMSRNLPRNVAGIATVALALAACGSPHGTSPHGTPAASRSTATASPASATTPGSCLAQFDAWKVKGAPESSALGTGIQAVGADDSAIGADLQAGTDTTSVTNKLAGDLGALEGAVYVIKADIPPSCVPGLDADYGAAVSDVGTFGIYNTELLGALNRGDDTAAEADSILANSELNAATGSLQAASNDISAFGASQSG